MTEHRIIGRVLAGSARAAAGKSKGQFDGLAVAYNTVDDYGSVWAPGVFNEGLAQRLPTVLYGHVWADLRCVLGRGIAWKDTAAGPVVTAQLDVAPEVPAAVQAEYQLRSGTLSDLSVGFTRHASRDLTADEKKKWPKGQEVITKATMDELSLVVRGAVPGAQVLATRRKPALTSRQLDIEARCAAEWVSRTYGARSEAEATRARREMGGSLDEFKRRVLAGKANLKPRSWTDRNGRARF